MSDIVERLESIMNSRERQAYSSLIDAVSASLIEITRLRAELSAARAAPGAGWRDIATAPKDGTLVLLGWSMFDMRVVGDFQIDRWSNSVDGEGFSPDPTHWQPLPAPPSAEAQPETGGECLSDRDATI